MSIFIYNSECYCEECAESCIEKLRLDFPDELTPGELKEFNQIIEASWDDSEDPEDEPLHCASGRDCPGAINCFGTIVGAWLENKLTDDGEKKVKEHILNKDRPEWKYWSEAYRHQLRPGTPKLKIFRG